jgi:exodeoxyribonuclease-3
MKIASWNVNGIRARAEQVLGFIASEKPDVLCLQELKATPDQVPQGLRELESFHGYWHGTKGYSGVALLVGRHVCEARPEFSHPAFDHDCRIVAARVAGVSVASVYVPNGGKDFDEKMRFLAALEAYAGAFRVERAPLVLLGDLNVARADIDVHPKERKVNAVGQRPDEREQFARILEQDLSDVAREREPDNDHLFTWWAPWRNMRQRDIGWRLDYALASSSLFARITSCRAYREIGTSDHAPIVVELEV